MAKAKDVEDVVESEEFDLSQWEFIDKIPTPEDVKNLLLTLPPWWGVMPVEFADYVQGLPSSKEVMVTQQLGDGRSRKVEQRREVITLYFSVAGRQQMIRRAQEMRDWLVDFEPEPVTPTGVPGYLRFDDKLVYREYCTVWAPVQGEVQSSDAAVKRLGDVTYVRLGRRPGTAWVPSSGGKQAAGSNPFEKVETSARGRALGAWGFGVLPGSGVASLEEMLGAPQNRQALDEQAAVEQAAGLYEQGSAPRRDFDRQEVMEELLTTITRIQTLTERTDYETNAITADWFLKKTGVDVVVERDPDTGEVLAVDLERVTKPGQLVLARDAFKKSLLRVQAEHEGI